MERRILWIAFALQMGVWISDAQLSPREFCERCSSKAACEFAGFVNGKVEFECKCKLGFTGNGTHCEDINECKEPRAVCNDDGHEGCSNTKGGFTCTCHTGYKIKSNNPFVCEDVDECKIGSAVCHSDATCSNTIGSYTCNCNKGLSGDGISVCRDSQTNRSSTVPTTAQGMSIGNKISVQLQSTTLTATTQPTTMSTAQSEKSPTFTRQWTTESATQPATAQVTTRLATVTLPTTTQSAIQLTTTAKLTKLPISKSTFNRITTKSTITKSTTRPITSPKDEVKSRCKNSTTVVRLGKGEQYAKVMLELSNHLIKMTLPPGEHNYEISSREHEERCYHKFMIYAWTGVVHSIQLKAEYQFDCTSLTSIAYSIIDASLLQHTKNLQRLCPGCHASPNQTLPVVKCLSNRLVVTWSTDLDQQQPFGDNPMKGLRRALLNYQESFPISTILQLTILSTSPRVVSPMKDKSGLYITPVITASCLKNGQIYDSVNQICLQRLNHRPQAPSSELARY